MATLIIIFAPNSSKILVDLYPCRIIFISHVLLCWRSLLEVMYINRLSFKNDDIDVFYILCFILYACSMSEQHNSDSSTHESNFESYPFHRTRYKVLDFVCVCVRRADTSNSLLFADCARFLFLGDLVSMFKISALIRLRCSADSFFSISICAKKKTALFYHPFDCGFKRFNF